MELKIDPEFRDFWPPLGEEEAKGLEAKLLQEGCTEPLLVWNGTLIDGHHRYQICMRNELPFETRQVEGIHSRDEALEWIFNYQKSRRNLNDFQRVEGALKMKAALERKAAERMRAGYPPHNCAEGGETRDVIAKKADVSRRLVNEVQTIKASAAVPVIRAARLGQVSVNAAAAVATLPKAEQPRTPEGIKHAAKVIRETKGKPICRWEFDDRVPDKVRDAFSDSCFDEALQALKIFAGVINHLCGEPQGGRPTQLGRRMAEHSQEMRKHVEELRRWIKGGRPHAVCPQCVGGGCDSCAKTGWIEKMAWEQQPKEMKRKTEGWVTE